MRIHYRRSFADPDLVGDPPVLPAHYHKGHYLALAGVRVSQRGRSLLALQSRKVAREPSWTASSKSWSRRGFGQELDRATLHRVDGHRDVATALMREAAALDWKDRKERGIAKMKIQSRLRRRATSELLPLATAAVAAGIFIADILTPPDVVVSGLYVVVVLMASRFCRPSGVVLVAAGCIGLVLAAYLLSAETAINAAIRIPAIGAATFLALQSLSAEARLREQAGLLDLAHV